MAESMDTSEVLPDEDDRKLFVGGLPQDAKQDDISAHFQTFGEIDNINLKTDPATGRSRGFAFVVFKTVDGLKDAVATEEHAVKGKKVAVKKAQAKQGKIYVGKLKAELSDEEIKSHFAQFGQIAQVEQPFDKTKNERKNFCFITFEKEDSAKQLLKAGTTTVNGVELEVKKVTPKPDPRAMGMMGMRGGGRGVERRPSDGEGQGEQELATKMLQIQSKRFYLDVKQNKRGKFIKVAEISADGRRSQIFLALSTAAEFRDQLSAFSDFYSSLGPPSQDNLPEDGKLKSEMMIKDNRRYYLDLKENPRGRFLRVSQTITRGGPRSQIAIPAQGMIEFRDALTDLIEEFGTEDGGFQGELPEGRHCRVENKNFYFDIGQNNRGIYMRISEVKTNFRTAITIPEKSWSRFRDIFDDYVDKMKEAVEAEEAEKSEK